MYEELYAIAKYYKDDCRNCKEVCCSNMALTITEKEIIRIAKKLQLSQDEFRKEYIISFKELFKHSKTEILTKEAKKQIEQNPNLINFNTIPLEKADFLSKSQKERLSELSKTFGNGKKLMVSVCPFYDTEKHKCKIYSVRPLACYQYPFNKVNEEIIDLRKINGCILSTNLLKRISVFLDYISLNINSIKKALDQGEYYNHFYLPSGILFAYIIWECEKIKIPLKTPFLVALKKEIINRYRI